MIPKRKPARAPWAPPTRRAFVAMIGAAAAALAVHRSGAIGVVTGGAAEPASDEVARPMWAGTTRWIGHC